MCLDYIREPVLTPLASKRPILGLCAHICPLEGQGYLSLCVEHICVPTAPVTCKCFILVINTLFSGSCMLHPHLEGLVLIYQEATLQKHWVGYLFGWLVGLVWFDLVWFGLVWFKFSRQGFSWLS